MDNKIKEKIEQKLAETLDNLNEIKTIDNSLCNELNSQSFCFGLIVGRIYNSYFYQHKRILNRTPTKDEFTEFTDLVNSYKKQILQRL